MATYPTLNVNRAYSALYNQFTLIATIGDNLAGLTETNADKFRVFGGEYGDQQVYTFSDVLTSRAFDPDDLNLLTPEQKAPVSQQAIVIDTYRTIGLYIPTQFLTKKAWGSENLFSSFNSVVESQVSNTKKLYEQRLVDVTIGNTKTSIGEQAQTIQLPTHTDAEAQNRLQAEAIAEKLANIAVEMKDSTRDFNDKEYMVSTPSNSCYIYINSEKYNKILKKDLPTIFNSEGLMPKFEVLPARYFGRAIVEGTDTDSSTKKAASGVTIRAKVELTVGTGSSAKHYFPGDKFDANTTFGTSQQVAVADAYVQDKKAIAKIIHKDAFKLVDSLSLMTDFNNGKNNSRNIYLHFGYGMGRVAVRPWVSLDEQ